jgi:4-alpha-glucanotransferase
MSKSEKEQGIKLVKSLYSIIATLPGVPTVYYGDEAGLEGYSDPFNRMPYPYGNESTDLLDHYRKIGNIRYNSDVLQDGSFELNILTSTLLVFTRKLKNAKIINVYNNSDIQTSIKFDATAKNLLTNETKKNFEIDANECLIFKTHSSTLII